MFYEIKSNYPGYLCIYTDGSKINKNIAAAAVSKDQSLSCRLPENSSIFTAELIALKLALEIIENSLQNKFLIVSDSLSVL